MNVRTTILSLTLLAAASLPLRAQPIIEPITQNPDAVLLRRIWTLTGSDGDRVGDDCGPVGDINGDSITDFAVHFGDQRRWRVYLGGSPAPTTEPVWILDSSVAVPGYPVYGDFFGDKKLTVGFGSFVDVNNGSSYSYQLRLFASMAGSLSDEEFAILDPYSRNKSELIYPATIQVANLDQELGDELLLAMSSMYKGGEYSQYPEIWLYRGGSGFTVDTPSYVIRDGEATIGDQFYTAKVMDLDGDRYMDLVTVGQYAEGYKLKMWFGTETSP